MKNFSLSLTTKNEFFAKVEKLLTENPNEAHYVNISKKKTKRSLPANAVQHVFYTQISQFTGTDIKQVASECKLDFGIPILLKDNEIGPVLGYALEKANFWSMTREQQIKFMPILQITSLMNTEQHNIYRDNLIYHYNDHGLVLKYKNDD